MGVSVICAFLHGAAQLAAAFLLVGAPCLYYMPVLCFFCSIAGIITGTLMNVLCVPAARMFEYKSYNLSFCHLRYVDRRYYERIGQ